MTNLLKQRTINSLLNAAKEPKIIADFYNSMRECLETPAMADKAIELLRSPELMKTIVKNAATSKGKYKGVSYQASCAANKLLDTVLKSPDDALPIVTMTAAESLYPELKDRDERTQLHHRVRHIAKKRPVTIHDGLTWCLINNSVFSTEQIEREKGLETLRVVIQGDKDQAGVARDATQHTLNKSKEGSGYGLPLNPRFVFASIDDYEMGEKTPSPTRRSNADHLLIEVTNALTA